MLMVAGISKINDEWTEHGPDVGNYLGGALKFSLKKALTSHRKAVPHTSLMNIRTMIISRSFDRACSKHLTHLIEVLPGCSDEVKLNHQTDSVTRCIFPLNFHTSYSFLLYSF